MHQQGVPDLEEMLGGHYAKLARNGHDPYLGAVTKPKEKLEDILDVYITIYRRGRDK